MAFTPLDIQVNMQGLNHMSETISFQNNYTAQEALRSDQNNKKLSQLKNSRLDEAEDTYESAQSNSEGKEAVDTLSGYPDDGKRQSSSGGEQNPQSEGTQLKTIQQDIHSQNNLTVKSWSGPKGQNLDIFA